MSPNVTSQNAVITGGLLAGCLLFAWEVSEGRLTSGDFVAFNMYMMQLYTPVTIAFATFANVNELSNSVFLSSSISLALTTA